MSRMGSNRSEARPRRQFSEEFKAGAVRLVLDEGRSISAVARELDLTASGLGLWVNKEVRILAEERDILKKVHLYTGVGSSL